MDSSDLKGFSEWHKFTLGNKENLLKMLPYSMGVYVIRHKRTFGRFISSSDIVYVGSAINKRGLKMRIRHYFHPGPTQWTSRRINQWLKKINDLEIAIFVLGDKEKVRAKEMDLLKRYENEHGELPPFNRNMALVRSNPYIN